MQTSIIDRFKDTPEGREAEIILRACVHCGFCTATCPTYQLLGNELDSPRGRIDLIKKVLEGQTPTRRTQQHLDRCLSCRSCETTCPSGVRYGHLADIGRGIVEGMVQRTLLERATRRGLRLVLPYPERFSVLLRLGQLFRPILPRPLKQKVPAAQTATPWPDGSQKRSMLVLEGCAQKAATPNTNAATARVLDRLGISLIREASAGCCGAVSYHLSAHERGARCHATQYRCLVAPPGERRRSNHHHCKWLRCNGEGLWTGSERRPGIRRQGCAHRLIGQGYLRGSRPGRPVAIEINGAGKPIAFQSPCSLQHGQKLAGVVESILVRLGFNLTPVADSHLCCGSAGTYSILQSGISRQLLDNKLLALEEGKPELIATANIGCQLHMETKTELPVKHWIELIDESS